EAEEAMTIKEVRYELNSRLAGRRGPGTCVSQRTVERWMQQWVSAGLVEPCSVRPAGQKGGRPSTGFRVLSLKCLPPDVANLSFFTENGSRGRDEVCDRVCDTPPEEGSDVANLGAVADETPGTKEAFAEGGKEVTQEALGALGSKAPEVCDSSRQKEGVSQTPSLETRSSTGIPEKKSEVCDTERGIKRDLPVRWDEGEWGPLDLG
ncbi:MAG: hypothetical protein ACO3PY_05985, partial [Pontimonas sp.]